MNSLEQKYLYQSEKELLNNLRQDTNQVKGQTVDKSYDEVLADMFFN